MQTLTGKLILSYEQEEQCTLSIQQGDEPERVIGRGDWGHIRDSLIYGIGNSLHNEHIAMYTLIPYLEGDVTIAISERVNGLTWYQIKDGVETEIAQTEWKHEYTMFVKLLDLGDYYLSPRLELAARLKYCGDTRHGGKHDIFYYLKLLRDNSDYIIETIDKFYYKHYPDIFYQLK